MTEANPFPGLRPFEADESHLFFGREQPTDELLGKLRTNRFIAVVGASGSGKSSLVRAGMLPDLYGGLMTTAGSRWRVAILRPGDAPIHALAAALVEPGVIPPAGTEDNSDMAAPVAEAVLRHGAMGLVDLARQARMAADENLLVVVDQFEEIFRFKQASNAARSVEEAAAFVKLLLEASKNESVPVYVVLTMRAEYLGDCTQFHDLPEAINSAQYLIPRMTRDQRRMAIQGPVAVSRATMSPMLMQRLLNDVGDNPDQLPILQHALMRTWDYWHANHAKGEAIDLRHYEAIGGMGHALSRHADEALAELEGGHGKVIAEKLFKRLTGIGSNNREMRFPTRFAELCEVIGESPEAVGKVIDTFRMQGRSFLMPPVDVPLAPESLIDISHESLIRIWVRLQLWLDEEAQSARLYNRLADTSDLHIAGEAGLWRNPDLQIALAWKKSNNPNEAWANRYHAGFDEAMKFLNGSRKALQRRQYAAIGGAAFIMLGLIFWGADQLEDAKTDLANVEDDLADAISVIEEEQELSDEQETASVENEDPFLAFQRGNVTDEKVRLIQKSKNIIDNDEGLERQQN